MAHDIALIEPNLAEWEGCVTYFLEQLDVEAHLRGRRPAYGDIIID
jgi:hypothetical protein